MKKTLVFMLAIMFMMPMAKAQNAIQRMKLFNSWDNYEVSTISVGQNGTKLIKVWGYGKKVDRAIVQAKKNAIHACLFRGLPASASANLTPPLISPGAKDKVLEENLDYFYDFFETAGGYLQFVNLNSDGMPSGQDRRKVKGGYKVAITVQVMYDNLKRKLEADGIIRTMNSGF